MNKNVHNKLHTSFSFGEGRDEAIKVHFVMHPNKMGYHKTMAIVISFFFLFACGQEEMKLVVIPSDVLPQKKMAQVISDIHIAEAEASMGALPNSTSTDKLSFQKIFEKNEITEAQYDTSLSFYIEHPELLDTIYMQALNELSKMQGEAAKEK